jgi:hypothetical protein
MALDIIISKEGFSDISMRITDLEHLFSRTPNQIGLPSETESTPNVFSLDLGVCVEQISGSGTCNQSGTSTKSELETVVREWWDYGDDPTNLAYLTITGGSQYYGHFKQMAFKISAGQSYWTLDFVFVVREQKA